MTPSNGEDFLLPAADIIGAPAELLSGDEEGRLSFAGATGDLPAGPGEVVVLDIGGGSTEIVTKSGGEILSVSLDIGCVRLTERFLRTDPPTSDEVTGALQAIGAELDHAQEAIPSLADLGPAARLVGLAGTVSTLASLELGLVGLRPAAYPPRGAHGRGRQAVVRRPGSGTRGGAGTATRPARRAPGRDLRRRAGTPAGDEPLRPAGVHRLGGGHPRWPHRLPPGAGVVALEDAEVAQ